MSTLDTDSIADNPTLVRAFVQEYFDAWKGTDVDRIMTYYADDVALGLPEGFLEGQATVREQFVRPFVAAFPGNVHAIRNLAHAHRLVAVEWTLEAVHHGEYLGHPASGRKVHLPGCSMYQYDLDARSITGGRIYFDVGTLLQQLGVHS